MANFSWQKKTALIIGIIITVFWFIFGMAEGLTATSSIIFGLIEGGIVGGIFAITTLIGRKTSLWGGIIFCLEGLYPMLMIVYHKSAMIGGLLIFGLPPLAVGILLVWDHLEAKGLFNPVSTSPQGS